MIKNPSIDDYRRGSGRQPSIRPVFHPGQVNGEEKHKTRPFLSLYISRTTLEGKADGSTAPLVRIFFVTEIYKEATRISPNMAGLKHILARNVLFSK
jgi:hypothetical protein